MSIRFAPLLISLALLSGNALADHVIKTLVPTEVRKSYDGLLVAMAATALDAPEERHDWTLAFMWVASTPLLHTTHP